MAGGNGTLTALAPTSNDAAEIISYSEPYVAHVRVRGSAAFLFHRWSDDAVEEKAKSLKGSKAKKTDDVESYVYRNSDGELSIPTEYFRQSLVNAARFRQDPRSPRKSAMDLYKAILAPITELCSLGTKEWDYLDRRRVIIQRSAITRLRPAMAAGWEVEMEMAVLEAEYIPPESLNEAFAQAGKLVGVGDFRPTYGRFQIVGFRTSAA